MRSETALIQTCGRAARNAEGRVIMYADKMTNSIVKTLEITNRRRTIQKEYNEAHGITPKTVRREIALLVEPEEEVVYPQEKERVPMAAEEISSPYQVEEHLTPARKEN